MSDIVKKYQAFEQFQNDLHDRFYKKDNLSHDELMEAYRALLEKLEIKDGEQ